MIVTIDIPANECKVTPSGRTLDVSLDVDTRDLDINEIAEHVTIERMFEVHGEQAVRDYVERNYDWFDKD